MSEHPQISAEANDAAIRAWLDARHPLAADRVRSIVTAVAPILWREWTRGMAVVPLPEPDRRYTQDCDGWYVPRNGDPQGRAAHVITAAGDDGVPMVWAQAYGQPWKEIKGSAIEMRRAAAAILAAADRAEQLAAEAKAVQP